MSHFARINDNKVTEVIVAEQDFIDTLPGIWIQCSYNTRGGIHKLGGVPLRKNYPGTGDIYDSVRDAFYGPKPFPSWNLNEETCLWEPPVPMPEPGYNYIWDEETVSWILRDK